MATKPQKADVWSDIQSVPPRTHQQQNELEAQQCQLQKPQSQTTDRPAPRLYVLLAQYQEVQRQMIAQQAALVELLGRKPQTVSSSAVPPQLPVSGSGCRTSG